jgi:hypothetical protein
MWLMLAEQFPKAIEMPNASLMLEPAQMLIEIR